MTRAASITVGREAELLEISPVVGLSRQSFHTPVMASPMSPDASLWLLDTLLLVSMEMSPPTPPEMLFSDQCSTPGGNDEVDTASTVACSTEGLR